MKCFYFLLLIPTASTVARGLGKGRGGGQSNLRRCQTKGWVRLATKGLLKWGKKFSLINGLSVCPEQAACTFRLPHRLSCANPLGHWHGWNNRCLKSIPHFLWVCKVVCSHSQILHRLPLCGNHGECPKCQGIFQLSLALSIVSTFESASQFSWSQTC